MYVLNNSYGTGNTKIATEKFPKYFCIFPLLRMSLHVTVCKALDRGLEAENTKEF
jgi:hypothetical protein